MTKTNTLFTKSFLKTLLWKQNKYHRHGVLLHTMRVVYYTLVNRDLKMLPAAFLHDVGKPLVAYQKEEDIALNYEALKADVRDGQIAGKDSQMTIKRGEKPTFVNFNFVS